MATQTTQPASGGKIGGYLQEVVKESRKVNWPKRQELVSNTTLTLISSFAVALFIFFFDQIFAKVLAYIY